MQAISKLTMIHRIRLEYMRRYAEAKRLHRPCAKELKALQTVTNDALRMAVRARRQWWQQLAALFKVAA